MPNITDTLNQRKNVHGDYCQAALIKDDILQVLSNETTTYSCMGPVGRETIRMIVEKLGRIAGGDWHFVDHWHDIAGYATLMVEYLERNSLKEPIVPPMNYEEGA